MAESMTLAAKQEFKIAVSDLLASLNNFSERDFNEQPSIESWSAAQVAEHMRKSFKGIARLLNGPAEKTERNPEQKIDQIKSGFLNFEVKMKAPEFVVPESKNYERDYVLKGLQQHVEEVNTAAAKLDLTETCTAFPFPVFGTLTRVELLYFCAYHAKRHIQQLKRISKELSM